jgi:hypothetical protein
LGVDEVKEVIGMDTQALGKEEFQAAVGNVLAEIYTVRDEFRHDRISREAYIQRVRTLREVGQRFHKEFRHSIMAAPLKWGKK